MNRWLRPFARSALRVWSRTGFRHGWFYRAMEAYGPGLAEARPLPAQLPTGQTIPCDLRDHVQRHIYFQGAYEPIEAYVFHLLLRPGMTVVDAGANVGQYALLASAGVGPTGRVHAFEPVLGTFERLRHHVEAAHADNVVLHRAALWHEEAVLRFALPEGVTGNLGSFAVASDGALEAAAVRFDDLVRDHAIGPVGLVKMDIEGSESSALRGMVAMLGRDRPMLLIEVNRAACARLSASPAELWGLLVAKLGYSAWSIGVGGFRPAPVSDGIVQENVLFTPGPLPAILEGACRPRRALRWAGHPGQNAAR